MHRPQSSKTSLPGLKFPSNGTVANKRNILITQEESKDQEKEFDMVMTTEDNATPVSILTSLNTEVIDQVPSKDDSSSTLPETLSTPNVKNTLVEGPTPEDHLGDEIIIDAFSKLKKDLPELKLIIVPRHPERADSILQILNRKKINSKISPDVSDLKNVDVIVVNTTGLLNSLYKIANITFIGGSLMSKYGGHNIIEAASNKCAFIVGPYMKNFEDVLNCYADT